MSSSSGSHPEGADGPRVVVRAAVPADARRIREIIAPTAAEGIVIDKGLVAYFESIQEFVVAEATDEGTPRVIGCGALHVLWDDIAEVRTVAIDPEFRRRGVGHRIVETLLARARELGLKRVFCLTFEVAFFRGHGFQPIAGTPVGTDVYAQMLRSHDEGVAEFLDLARVKPNTLGNTRMMLEL